MLAGYGLLGKEAPPYVALVALPVTKDNSLDAWKDGLPRRPASRTDPVVTSSSCHSRAWSAQRAGQATRRQEQA